MMAVFFFFHLILLYFNKLQLSLQISLLVKRVLHFMRNPNLAWRIFLQYAHFNSQINVDILIFSYVT